MKKITSYSIFCDEYKEHVSHYIKNKGLSKDQDQDQEIEKELKNRWDLIPDVVKSVYIKRSNDINEKNKKHKLISSLKSLYKKEYGNNDLDDGIIEEYKYDIINNAKEVIENKAINKLVTILSQILCNDDYDYDKKSMSDYLKSYINKIRRELILNIKKMMFDEGIENELKEEIKRNMDLDNTSNIICTICMEKERGILFIPCRHIVCCKICSYKCEKCPICRTSIYEYIEVYI